MPAKYPNITTTDPRWLSCRYVGGILLVLSARGEVPAGLVLRAAVPAGASGRVTYYAESAEGPWYGQSADPAASLTLRPVRSRLRAYFAAIRDYPIESCGTATD